ncbi:hypothetical protein [Streptomyces sp. NPDC019937]|uniref:hypothetical protein n=1 Tax=Streptomyces sp. NPDC019937 TaxID=3154787 RepID=UPI0033D6D5C6
MAADPAEALRPLAAVIEQTLRATPVQLGTPEGITDLTAALTAAVAIYTARHVLPPGALDQAQPIATAWHVEIQRPTGAWITDCPEFADRAEALGRHAAAEAGLLGWPARVVRTTTVRTIEKPPTPHDTAPAEGSDH